MQSSKKCCDTETTEKENKLCCDHCLLNPLLTSLELYNSSKKVEKSYRNHFTNYWEKGIGLCSTRSLAKDCAKTDCKTERHFLGYLLCIFANDGFVPSLYAIKICIDSRNFPSWSLSNYSTGIEANEINYLSVS